MTQNGNTNSRYEYFLRLFMANQDRIFGFVLTMVPDHAYADDIMQETIMTMWRKFGDFEPETNFAAWGIAIARYNILKFREKHRTSSVMFSSEALQHIMSSAGEVFDELDDRLVALQGCLEKLNEKDGNLIKMRYGTDLTVKAIAQKVGRPVGGMYKAMARIHNLLQQCINRTLTAWEITS